MPISTDELPKAREAAQALLERLGLEAYLFEVEPREGQWELRVGCAVDDDWQSVVFPIEKASLLLSQEDSNIRERVPSQWGEHLKACKKAPEPRSNPPSAR